jgi:cellulose synthase operon protein YhjQ
MVFAKKLSHVIAITSGQGGVGRTSVCANLAVELTRRNKKVLCIDFDPQNALGVLLGLEPNQSAGLSREGINLTSIFDSPFGVWESNENQVDPDMKLHFIPFGRLTAQDLHNFIQELRHDPQWLARCIDQVRSVHFDFILIDTPSGNSVFLEHSLQVASVVLAVVHADASSYINLPSFESTLQQLLKDKPSCKGPYVLVNQMPAKSRLSHQVRAALLESSASRMVPVAIHDDIEVPTALAQEMPVSVSNLNSSASIDFQYLANWLLDTVEQS